MTRAQKHFGENVCNVDSTIQLSYINLLPLQLSSDEVVADVDVFRSTVELGIMGECDCPLVVGNNGHRREEA